MLNSRRPMNPRLVKFLNGPNLLVAAAVIAGGLRALVKGLQNRPEWSYYRRLATEPLADTLGPDKSMFGYFPGVSTLFKPFFAVPEPLGLIALILLNVVSCLYVVRFVRKYVHIPQNDASQWGVYLSAAACAGPIFLAIQNSQIVAPAVALSLFGYRYLTLGTIWGTLLIAFSCLIKTIPLSLLGLGVLKGRWKESVSAGLFVVMLTFGLATMGHGIRASLDAHLLFPEAVRAQEPARLITEGATPRTIDSNLSLAAVIVASREYIGDGMALFLRRAMFWGSSLLTLMVWYRRRADTSPDLHLCAFWIAWTIMAAPFGRYYYLLFLVPAWSMIIGHYVRPEGRSWRNFALGVLVISPVLARDAVFFSAITVATYVLAFRVMLTQPVSTAASTGLPQLDRPIGGSDLTPSR